MPGVRSFARARLPGPEARGGRCPVRCGACGAALTAVASCLACRLCAVAVRCGRARWRCALSRIFSVSPGRERTAAAARRTAHAFLIVSSSQNFPYHL